MCWFCLDAAYFTLGGFLLDLFVFLVWILLLCGLYLIVFVLVGYFGFLVIVGNCFVFVVFWLLLVLVLLLLDGVVGWLVWFVGVVELLGVFGLIDYLF